MAVLGTPSAHLANALERWCSSLTSFLLVLNLLLTVVEQEELESVRCIVSVGTNIAIALRLDPPCRSVVLAISCGDNNP